MKQVEIIAEIGINHEGSAPISRARLVDAAHDAGVHAVKFQYRNLDNAYADAASEIGDEILRAEIRRNYLPPDTLLELAAHATGLGMEAGISFFDVADLDDFGNALDAFAFFKVPSAELANERLVDALIARGRLVYLSTGCHLEREIERALERLPAMGWMPLHCVSNYPVSPANPKLGYLDHLARRWQRPVGYSSHDSCWEVCLLAMQHGAVVIERHITFDKNAPGLDHSTSSTPEEFRRMVELAANLRLIAAGDGPRVPNQGELLNLQNLGRSYYAREVIDAGATVTPAQVQLRSPRVGLGATEAEPYFGHPTRRPLAAGEVLTRSAFEAPAPLSDAALAFARAHRLALPVRLHDIERVARRFPLGAFEFHLSFGEVLSGPSATRFDPANAYSIHLPDYINPVELMDPFSPRAAQAALSRDILERTAAFAAALQDHCGRQVPIVGSFSQVHGGLARFHEQHAELFASYHARGIHILPQWLPPIAWYFGGSVRLDAMNALADVALLERHDTPICLDVCHLCMGREVLEASPEDVFDRLAGRTGHLHLAEANGIDGEGLHFDEGDPANRALMQRALRLDTLKVIEVWQGHLDGGAGFARALNTLAEMYGER
jgi:sialic acid synthase SpsE/sugar phosphate isomerase/epimerase